MIKREDFFSGVGASESERFIHTPGSFAKKNLLYVQEAGYLKSISSHKCVREKLNSFLFMVVLDGKGELSVNEKKYSIKKGDVALINCMEHYEHISSETEPWKLGWVHFNGNSAIDYYELFEKKNKGRNVVVSTDFIKYKNLIDGIMSCQHENSFKGELICGERILNILNMLINDVYDENGDINDDLLRELRKYLNENFMSPNVLSDVYSSFEIKETGLDKGFENKFGISIEEYIDNRRFNYAKELLRFTVSSADEIATISGIGDSCSMNALFRSREGMTPDEYRSKWAGWIRA